MPEPTLPSPEILTGSSLPSRIRRRVRILVLVLLPCLFLQLYYAKWVEEPYPAFLFPLFGGVNGKNGIYPAPAEQVSIFAGQDTIPSSKKDIFGMANESYHFHLMRDFLGPETPEVIREDPEYKDWLYQRLRVVTGRGDVTGIEVVWIMKYFDSNVTPAAIFHDTSGYFNLQFLL